MRLRKNKKDFDELMINLDSGSATRSDRTQSLFYTFVATYYHRE
jgi:hypothetical protein